MNAIGSFIEESLLEVHSLRFDGLYTQNYVLLPAALYPYEIGAILWHNVTYVVYKS